MIIGNPQEVWRTTLCLPRVGNVMDLDPLEKGAELAERADKQITQWVLDNLPGYTKVAIGRGIFAFDAGGVSSYASYVINHNYEILLWSVCMGTKTLGSPDGGPAQWVSRRDAYETSLKHPGSTVRSVADLLEELQSKQDEKETPKIICP